MESDLRSMQDSDLRLKLQVRAQATRADEQAKQESELRTGKTEVESLLQALQARERRLQSITERGQHGERVLDQLLAELTSGGYAESYSLQPEIVPGKRPDAVVTLVGGKCMVVDSKAPRPPSALLETGCEDARREYVIILKRHISELGSKKYHAVDERSLSRTWLLLPGEGYLQAAYAADGSDSNRLHEYAAERAVTLVGPNGLRSALQHHTLLQLETEALSRLEDAQVQKRLRQLQPAWTEDVLPRARGMGKDIKKLVSTFNDLSEVIKAFDVDLRARDALDLPKARKTNLPVVIVGPAEEHLEPEDTVRTHSLAAPDETNATPTRALITPEARRALRAELRKVNVSREAYVGPELRECDAQGFMAAGVLLWCQTAGLHLGHIHVLMAQEQRNTDQSPLLGFIGGKRDALGESARQTAAREVTEETGELISEATRAAILTAPGPVLWDSGGKYATFVVEVAPEDADLPRRLDERGGPPDPWDPSLKGVRWVELDDVLSETWCKGAVVRHHQQPLRLLWPHLRALQNRVTEG